MKRLLVVIVLVASSLFIIGADNSCETSTGSDTETPSAGPGSETEAIVVDASAMVDEFDANQLAAEEKYNGKIVQITAYVFNISSALGNNYAQLSPTEALIDISGPNPSITSFQCYAEKDQLTKLVNGQQVTVKGKVNGQMMGIIGLDDCTIIG